jgi:hypothetical protein
MGLIKWASQKVKNQLRDKTDPEVKAAREKGYRQGALEGAEKAGREQGMNSTYKKGGQRRGGVTRALQGLEYGINNTEKNFGFGSGGGSMGSNMEINHNLFGLPGFGTEPKKNVPQRVTTVNPHTGKVTITEPSTRPDMQKRKKPANPYEWEVHNFFEDF